MIEIWRDVVNFENHYEVSNFGNVRRKGSTKNLKHTIANTGYCHYGFSIDSIYYNTTGHQLVAAAFIGPCPAGMKVLHKNDIGHDNIITNIYYGTAKDNGQDSIRNGGVANGIKHGMSKLTDQDIYIIRAWTGPNKDMVEQYNVSKSLISQIKRNKIWRHI